jgi:hypothetical protein
MPQNNYENRDILIKDIIEEMDMSDLVSYVYENMQSYFEVSNNDFLDDWLHRFGEDDTEMQDDSAEKEKGFSDD